MTYYVLFTNNGLVGVTNESPSVDFDGLMIDTVDGNVPDLNKVTWNNQTHTFDRVDTTISKLDFMSRFTAQERIAITNSADVIVKDAMSLLQMAEFIDVLDQRTMMLVGYLAMSGIIANERVPEILA